MFAQYLLYVFLFGLFVWCIWKVAGKRLLDKLEEPETVEEQREALMRKILALQIQKKNLETITEEIVVTTDLTKVKTQLQKAEDELKELDEGLESMNVEKEKGGESQKINK